MKLEGAPAFNGKPLSKRAKRQVGFVLQARTARPPQMLPVPHFNMKN